jgi:(E)-4-hydroxy-3-methylbut-2-enyl-diphosphate synthase
MDQDFSRAETMISRKITIQTMCDTKTEDVASTVAQIKELEKEGCDLVRVAVPNEKAAKAIKEIKKQITIPLIADIHFDYRLAIMAIRNGADKIRINPGNIHDEGKIRQIIAEAKKYDVSIRIGVNSGSLEKELIDKYGGVTSKGLVESALKWLIFFEKENFKKVVISIKSSDTKTTIQANNLLYKKLKNRKTLYPIHLGVTEAGTLIPGIVRNTVALSHLLSKGIGDTIRISLTESPIHEIRAAKELLKALNLYDKEPIIISCPTCGRTEVDLKRVVKEAEEQIRNIKFLKKPCKIAIMGCIVNGPGEAHDADYAICCGLKSGALFRSGKFIKSVDEKELVKELMNLIKQDN